MSDKMIPIPYSELLNWVLEEKKTKGTVFGIHRPFAKKDDRTLGLFGEKLETPFGPAAGPHTQLAQNIIAAYYAGSRFFELKTVQILDGEDLPVSKPCIRAEDECYNVEWSTELYVPQAFGEYVKAWVILKLISREFGLGRPDGFVFNMSVGYDLEGIRSEKIDRFIEGMKQASETAAFRECIEYTLHHLDLFEHITREDVEAIPAEICTSITLSTLHGCPPQEIERIATYLITEKKLNTFIKCNPTLLGFDFARKTMDEMGYDYVAFGDFHFKDDLQYEDAVPMFRRLISLAAENGVEFGVKLTNTFPVDIRQNELPGEEMYMSGRSLYPLTIALAAKLSEEFAGALRISYSGGADYHNIGAVYDAGIWPITLATTVLKPGGYQRLVQIAQLLEEKEYKEFAGVDVEAVKKLKQASVSDKNHRKSVKPAPSRKMKQEVPLIDCFTAPCKEGCPIHQDITVYMKLAGEGSYAQALRVILRKNPLPFITGTICAHNCMSKCTRSFYEEPVHIRDMKLLAAEGGYDEVIGEIRTSERKTNRKAAVIGAGPAGLSAAYFLARAGVPVTVFEKQEKAGGVVRNVIPEFRIPEQAIEKDTAIVKAAGAEILLGCEVKSVNDLKEDGYDFVILANGAAKAQKLTLKEGEAVNAIEFLAALKSRPESLTLGENVVVVGGGNTAMDAARAAKRAAGVKHAKLVYRRTRRYMPADEEELLLAMEDGVEFLELLAPVSLENGELVCHKVVLGEPDESGRRAPIETQECVNVPCDTVVASLGEKVDDAFLAANAIPIDAKGRAAVNPDTLETGLDGVFAVGDGLYGPATVVEAIRDAGKAASAILKKLNIDVPEFDAEAEGTEDEIAVKKGNIKDYRKEVPDSTRCLQCSAICENCVEVCPNRANIAIRIPGREKPQILHVDRMCNECGNCAVFCPYASSPYLDKFTLFRDEEGFADSKNQGFALVDGKKRLFRVRLGGRETVEAVFEKDCELYTSIKELIQTVYQSYRYLF